MPCSPACQRPCASACSHRPLIDAPAASAPCPTHLLAPRAASATACRSEKLDVLDHYVAWRQTHDMPQHAAGTDGPFSFCSYPFLLNPRAKSKLLHTEARIQMDQVRAAAGGGCWWPSLVAAKALQPVLQHLLDRA